MNEEDMMALSTWWDGDALSNLSPLAADRSGK
jgi:hypothetical protein